MRLLRYSDKELIEIIRTDPEKGLRCIYKYYQKYCVETVKKLFGDDDFIEDAFQEAVFVLYQRALNSEFTLTYSIGTFLVSICKNKILDKKRKRKREVQRSKSLSENTEKKDSDNEPKSNKLSPWFENENLQDELAGFHDYIFTDEYILNSIINEMRETNPNCYQIFSGDLNQNISTLELVQELRYRSSNTLKTMRSRCLRVLKTKFFQNRPYAV